MKPLLAAQIAETIGAPYSGPAEAVIQAVSTDTRTLPEECLFVALRGDNFDGNDYAAKALEQGAALAVVERLPQGVPEEKILLVKDGRQALMDIAGLYRRSLDVKVVGITGSVGKTTTKEMVACVMESAFPTLKTPLNLNNEVGLSQTILQLEEHHKVAVLEMGMDGPGQMAPLSRCAAPDVAILTNIGVSHIQQFGSREAIRNEKLDIAAEINPQGILILNGDDDMLATVSQASCARILRYGMAAADVDVRAENIKEYSTHTTFEIVYNRSRFDAQIPAMGRHNVGNALAAFLAGIALGVEPAAATAALKNYRPAGMRQNVVPHGEFTVVEDCYNASPDSMRAALETLGRLRCGGRRIAVLSDMLELGEIAPQAHREIGKAAAQSGADLLLAAGELARHYVEGANGAGMEQARFFRSQEELFQHLKGLLGTGDVVWFKASRGMHLEQVIEKVYKEC